MIEAVTETDRPSKYWSDLKKQLYENEGFIELSANIGQLKYDLQVLSCHRNIFIVNFIYTLITGKTIEESRRDKEKTDKKLIDS